MGRYTEPLASVEFKLTRPCYDSFVSAIIRDIYREATVHAANRRVVISGGCTIGKFGDRNTPDTRKALFIHADVFIYIIRADKSKTRGPPEDIL